MLRFTSSSTPLLRQPPVGKSKPKRVQAPQSPAPRKEVPCPQRLLGVANALDGDHPKWRLSLLDLEHAGNWSWTASEEALRKVVKFLTEMERLTWAEIRSQMFNSRGGSHRKHHTMVPSILCPEAQKRLRELKLDDVDELFRFRLGNMERLWGVIDADGIFYPVWWDPEHKVYPSDQ
jgi:hypothetical protein